MDLHLFFMLVTQVWQVTLLAGVVWVVVKICAQDRPHLAHALWILVLLKCITPPVWSSPTSPFSWATAKTHPSVKQVAFTDLQLAASRPLRSLPTIVVQAKPVGQEEGDRKNGQAVLGSLPAMNFGTTTTQVASRSKVSPDTDLRTSWSERIFWFWMVGVGIGFLVTAIRFIGFLFWIRQSPSAECSRLESVVDRLSTKLKLRRRVRIRILHKPVGPAVIGLFRPTILLPQSVVAGKSEKELEPLIAHELIHIRRGDLWWAMLQTVAKHLFWFHPLIWFAVAMVTRESERSCDEETVVSLGCSPADYARGLLEVLELKNRLRVAPALPGVRPVDITSARLERVMKLGNGSHRKTPVWVWLVMLVCGAIVLPGAAMVFAQENDSSKPSSTGTLERTVLPKAYYLKDDIKSDEEIWRILSAKPPAGFYLNDDIQYFAKGPEFKLTSKPSALIPERLLRLHQEGQPLQQVQEVVATSSDAKGEEWVFASFDIKAPLDLIRAAQLERFSPEQRLILEFPCRYPDKKGKSTPQGRDIRFMSEQGEVHLGGSSQTMKVVGDKLYVFDTKRVMTVVKDILAGLNQHGFSQIVVESRFVTTEKDDLKNLGINWSIGHSAVGKLSNPKDNVTSTDLKATYIGSTVGQIPATSVGQIPSVFSPTSERTQSKVRAASFVEKSSPVVYALVDDEQAKSMVQKLRGLPQASQTQAPTVTMFSGQSAQIMDGSQRPFVVGLNHVKDASGNLTEAFQPVIRIIPDGLGIALTANSMPDDSVELDCTINMSQILSVDTFDVPIARKEGKITIQVPEIATSQIHSAMNVPHGKTLMLASFREGKKGKQEAFLVMLKCRSFVHIPEVPMVISTPEKISQTRAAEILETTDGMPTMMQYIDQNGELKLDQESASQQQAALVNKFNAEHPIAVESPPETAVEQSNLHVILKSDEPSEGNEIPENLIEAFRHLGIELKVVGKFDYEVKGDRIFVSANKISLGMNPEHLDESDESFDITGDHGELEIGTDLDLDVFMVRFTGNVKMRLDDMQMSADQIIYGNDGNELHLNLTGKASFIQGDDQLSAEHIKIAIEGDYVTLLEGDAHLIRQVPRTNIRADKIEWNGQTDEIISSNNARSPKPRR